MVEKGEKREGRRMISVRELKTPMERNERED